MIRLLSQFIFITTIISMIGFSFWLAYKPWFKLSKVFGSFSAAPEIFFENQTCIFDTDYTVYLKGCINIGVSEEKLYLSHTSPLSYLIRPLLIDLDAITIIEPFFNPLLNKCYKLFIGSPNITTLILANLYFPINQKN